MCWVLYVAADRPLPFVPWDTAAPAFNVTELSAAEERVRAQFRKPFVVALGAHTGCGCGFDRGQANPDHPEELEATRASLAALAAYLRAAVRDAGELELYACWDGDQGAPPDHRLALRPEDFGPAMGWFPDRTFATVARRADDPSRQERGAV